MAAVRALLILFHHLQDQAVRMLRILRSMALIKTLSRACCQPLMPWAINLLALRSRMQSSLPRLQTKQLVRDVLLQVMRDLISQWPGVLPDWHRLVSIRVTRCWQGICSWIYPHCV
ncbi:hypothetical protein D9M69_688150 [compost metagenome]